MFQNVRNLPDFLRVINVERLDKMSLRLVFRYFLYTHNSVQYSLSLFLVVTD